MDNTLNLLTHDVVDNIAAVRLEELDNGALKITFIASKGKEGVLLLSPPLGVDKVQILERLSVSAQILEPDPEELVSMSAEVQSLYDQMPDTTAHFHGPCGGVSFKIPHLSEDCTALVPAYKCHSCGNIEVREV